MFLLDRLSVAQMLGLAVEDQSLFFGAVGLGVGASVAAWIELWWLRVLLRRRLTSFALPWRGLLQMTGLSGAALLPSFVLWWLLPAWPVIVIAVLVVGTYGLVYLGLAHLFHFTELETWAGRFFRRLRKS